MPPGVALDEAIVAKERKLANADFVARAPAHVIEKLLRRQGNEGVEEAFHPEQRLSLPQALRAHLEEPNRVAGWRTPLGRIEPGWGADLVAFDQDLLRIAPDQLDRAKTRGVWVAGSQVYGKSL